MRAILLSITVVASGWSYAWTCPETDNSRNIEKHWSAASDIFWGRVINGQYQDGQAPYANNVEFEVKIFETFKGNKSGKVKLETSHETLFGGVEIGGNYIIFLYGNNVVDHCNVPVNVAHQFEEFDKVKDFYSSQRGYTKEVVDYISSNSLDKP